MRSAYLASLILSFGIVLTYGGFVLAQEEILPPQGMSGPHKVLPCAMCHGEGVWHEAEKDVTVCQNCHPDQWETLSTDSRHVALMREGTIQRGDKEYKVRYCATCHSPHNNDFLRIETQDGEKKYYTFDDFMPLCINCHSFGGAGVVSAPINGSPVINRTTTRTITNTTTTTTTNTTTTTTTTTRTTTISMAPDALAISLASTLRIEGQIDPAAANVEVVIRGKPAGSGDWEVLGTVRTDAFGKYEYEWTPTTEGNFVFQASYGELNSGIYTVIVTGEEPSEEGILDTILNLFPSPIFLLAAVVAIVAVVVTVIFSLRRK